MKNLTFLIILSITLFGCQKEVTSDKIIFDSSSNKVVIKNSGNKPFTGKVLHHNKEGLLEYELQFKNGINVTEDSHLKINSLCNFKKEKYEYYWDIELDSLQVFMADLFIPFSGIFVYDSKDDSLFNDNEYNIEIKSTYNNGIRNGITKYYSNGKLQNEIEYKNGKIHGKAKGYNSSGTLISIANYAKGKLSGVSISFHNNGKVISEVNYENGIIIDDEVSSYYDTGAKKSKFQCKSGKINGKWTYWKEDGTLLDNGEYQDGNGIIKRYYDNNQLKFEANYKNDKYNGIVAEYSEKGQTLRKENYVDGLLNGDKFLYYENGNIKEKATYILDKIEGKKVEYFENGTIKNETDYKDGKKNGWSLNYNEKGDLQYELYYVNGKYEYKEYKRINPQIKRNIKFVKAKLERYEKDYGRSSEPYRAHVRAYFQFKNTSSKTISAIKFDFIFKDAFGDILYESSAKYDLNLKSGSTSSMNHYWYWEDSYLSSYSKLWSPVESGNVKTEVTITKIVFSNGDTIE